MKAELDKRRMNDPEHLRLRLERLAVEAKSISRMVPEGFSAARNLLDSATPGCLDDLENITVRREIRLRRLRDDLFPDGLFADPAWDLLLDLYTAHLDGVPISVTSACIAACVPPTTALRWITRLEQFGLVVRSADALDGRRTHLCLSSQALDFMRKWAAAMRGQNMDYRVDKGRLNIG